MSPSASTEEVRIAYRALAGRLHPDRVIAGSAAERALAERRMREVNEAWQVLQDPGRRRAYDTSRLVGRGSAPGTTSGTVRREHTPGSGRRGTAPDRTVDDDLVEVAGPMGPVTAKVFRHGPWLVLVVVLAVIFVATAYAGGGSDPADLPAAVHTGACVNVVPGPTTTIVSCNEPHELRIERRVADGRPCPAGTEKRRLGTDGLLDCVTTR